MKLYVIQYLKDQKGSYKSVNVIMKMTLCCYVMLNTTDKPSKSLMLLKVFFRQKNVTNGQKLQLL